MSGATSHMQVEGLLAAITAMERAQVDLDRAVVITGIGALLADDIRERLVRMRVVAQRVRSGVINSQKATKETKAVPVSVYVTVRHVDCAYIARTSPPAPRGEGTSVESPRLAACAAARHAFPKGKLFGAFDQGNDLWRVEFSATS